MLRFLKHSSHILSEVKGGSDPQVIQKAPSDMLRLYVTRLTQMLEVLLFEN
jgi:hypothetical protein